MTISHVVSLAKPPKSADSSKLEASCTPKTPAVSVGGKVGDGLARRSIFCFIVCVANYHWHLQFVETGPH